MAKVSPLVQHAQNELRYAGLYDDDADYGNGAIADSVLGLVEVLSSQGHSGGSHAMTMAIFNKVANFEPLTEIGTTKDEWTHVANENGKGPLYQNKRRLTTFSRDGGVTWYDIEDASRNNGDVWL